MFLLFQKKNNGLEGALRSFSSAPVELLAVMSSQDGVLVNSCSRLQGGFLPWVAQELQL